MTGKPDRLLKAVRERRDRHRFRQRSGEPSFAGYLAQVGVLGWTIVLPTLAGLFAGRWIDRRLGTGIFWTGPLMLLGLAAGCWAAWRWMHRQ
ncbi:MAG: AtpZ/AtpI family protein [Rhodospirillales bacterium]|nr:AtpZ/AtpI family protein [Rhodospirillales bacterium]